MTAKTWLGHTCWRMLAVVVVITLIGCAGPRPPRWNIGLYAIAPDGQRASVLEHTGDPLTWQLVGLDLRQGGSRILAQGIDPDTDGSFSPDGRYLLVHASEGWSRVDTSTGQRTSLDWKDQTIVSVQFLPNGDLLVVSDAGDGTQSFETFNVADLLRADISVRKVQYSFSAQRPASAISTLGTILPFLGVTGPIQTCVQRSVAAKVRWLLISADDRVFILSAEPGSPPSSTGLPNKLSASVIRLLDQQEEIIKAKLAPLPSGSQKGTPAPSNTLTASPTLSPELIHLYAGLSALGGLSPAPSKNQLFFMLTEFGQDDKPQFSLYLIDLSTNAEPQLLSTRTPWVPSFTFSPDGQQILFESNLFGSKLEDDRLLYIGNSDGTHIQRVVDQTVAGVCWY